ncbi:MAG: response regulator transcription factor [Myxococcales bacterium]|nr:response regulator transcription factor [Myxococcales bacterium]MCB9530375.1 response regulator transcription factor [Myxococcales bacterium]
MTQSILVVDDDRSIREVVCFALQKAGFDTHEAADGRQALVVFGRTRPALVVLDINMPELSGTDVCRAIRADSNTPIVFLSSNDDEIDRVLGLELGGDDYVTKPFSPRELVTRVKAVLRRCTPTPEPKAATSTQLTHGPLELDLDRFEARWRGTLVTLTVTEFGILRTLMRYPGKVYSREALMQGAYEDYTIVSDRTIDSHVRRVRRKFEVLGGEVIDTVHGVGYRLHGG